MLLGLADFLNARNQSDETSVDFFVRQIFDTLLLADFQLLLGVDVGLVGIAEGVLEQELRTLRATLGLKETVGNVGFNLLESEVDDSAMFSKLLVFVVEVDNDLRSEAQE